MKYSTATKLAFVMAVFILLSCSVFILLRWPGFQQEMAHVQATNGALETTRLQRTVVSEAAEASSTGTTQAIALMTSNAPTYTPLPTSTPTSTVTPLPTPSNTPTPSPTPIVCAAQVNEERQMFMQPSRGRLSGSTILKKGTEVTVEARLTDSLRGGGWWPVKYQGQNGWLLGQFLDLMPECEQVSVRDLADLLGYPAGYEKVVQDTFTGNVYNWVDQNDLPIQRTQDNDERMDYYLSLNSSTQDQVSIADIQSSDPLNVTNFEMVTSFYRLNDSLESYVGIRFRVSAEHNSYYELRLMPTCHLYLYQHSNAADPELFFEDNAASSNAGSSCRDGIEDYLYIKLDDGELTISLNDIRFPIVTLPSDTLGEFTRGHIELISFKTNTKFYFLSVSGEK